MTKADGLRAWESHVRRDDVPSETFCGVFLGIGGQWAFTGAQHAIGAVEKNMYAQPCPACLEAIRLRPVVKP